MKNPAWLKAVRRLDTCVDCGKWGVQAAHRNEGKGVGVKVSDHLTAALCPECHYDIDNGKNMTREQRRAAMDRAIVKTFDRLVELGIVGLL